MWTLPFFLLISTLLATGEPKNPVENQFQGFALVELYTSQGCSSCPPADRVLQEVLQEAEKNQLPVYGLSLHVDYWNRLGWKDPYSQSIFSLRQRAYAKSLPDRVYTPQMVVNGKWGFVGSRKGQAREIIQKALNTPAKAGIVLAEESQKGKTFSANYQLQGEWEGTRLLIALVDGQLGNAVPHGENAGRNLHHVKVVRSLSLVDVEQPSGTLNVDLDPLEDLSNGEIVVFLQHNEKGHILAAKKMDLD